MAKQVKDLARDHRKIMRAESVVETAGKNDVWLIELGQGKDEERKQRPAMLVVAGIEGNDLAGTVSALAWVESLLAGYEKDPSVRRLLDSTTLYVFPRLNPDAAASFFAKPKVETSVTTRPNDDDHDGLADEDGPEDLDEDGLVTWMRVEDAEGEFVFDPAEPRLLLKADRAKSEKGAWKLFREGRDNDKDEAWNEDGAGGVNCNRNFPYNYKFFAESAGQHQVSEPETRALADFIVAHPNIGIAFTFGAADNLVQTPKAESAKRPPVTIHEEDIAYYRELGKSWRETLGLKKELQLSAEPGTFSDWMYFHRGRLSLAARPWSPAWQVELSKAKSKSETEKPEEEKKPEHTEDPSGTTKAERKPTEPDKRNEEERAFLKWVEEEAKDQFVPWKTFEHPDFPGRKVEIGGFAPYAKSNPPERLLPELAAKHGKFLTDLAGKLPRIGIRKTEAKHLGESIYEVKVQVENTGYLPTALAQGNLTREVLPTRLVLKLEDKAILAGTRFTALGAIEGSGGMKEARYIIRAKDRKEIELEVSSALGGTAWASIALKEGN